MSPPRSTLRTSMIMLGLAAAWPVSAENAPVVGQATLQHRVEQRLREMGPGPRFGLVVATEAGKELVAIAPTDRFIPASNTKIFTTAAAFAMLPALDRPEASGGTVVRLEVRGGRRPDVILEGRGDARMSSANDCVVDCLAVLADAVAARVRTVGNVVGDDSYYPDLRWSLGMSWNNISTRSGTAVSALSLDDNEVPLLVTPAAAGQTPILSHPTYFTIDNRAVTVATGETALEFDRLPFSMALRLTGTIVAGAKPETIRLGIDDPAHYAAWTFKRMLEDRGVRVHGNISVRHRAQLASDTATARPGEMLAQITPPPLASDLTRINKDSQNLYAELMLRRLGKGSSRDGLTVVEAMLKRAAIPREAYDFSDGSGMSTYNRVAPRGMVRFLRWIVAQPWGAAWRATLAVGGVDGTLARRFSGTPLQGRIFAKTGGLNATSALSGYLIAKSGRTLIFSTFANDVPSRVDATKAIDAALQMVADAN